MELKSQLFSLGLFCDYEEGKRREERLHCGCKRNEEFEDINNNDSRAVFLGIMVSAGWLFGQH